MGHLMDVCPPASLVRRGSLEERLEAEFVCCLVCQAGLVMAGEKPAAIFGFMPRARAEGARRDHALVSRLVSVYARGTLAEGVRIVPLGWREERLMLLVWRPGLVARAISEKRVATFLVRSGLPAHETRLMSALARRLRACYAGTASFPHEIGIVLGYPLEDVEGFMADGGRGACACGRWKVYGDVGAARRRFEELGCAERRVRRLFSEGVPMRELLRLGVA